MLRCSDAGYGSVADPQASTREDSVRVDPDGVFLVSVAGPGPPAPATSFGTTAVGQDGCVATHTVMISPQFRTSPQVPHRP